MGSEGSGLGLGWAWGKPFYQARESSLVPLCLLKLNFLQKTYIYEAFVIVYTVSPKRGFGFNEVPASDNKSEWARNPN